LQGESEHITTKDWHLGKQYDRRDKKWGERAWGWWTQRYEVTEKQVRGSHMYEKNPRGNEGARVDKEKRPAKVAWTVLSTLRGCGTG